MDDLTGALSKLLEKPDAMEKIKAMADSLLNNGAADKKEEDGVGGNILSSLLGSAAAGEQAGGLAGDLSLKDISGMVKIFSALKNEQNDSRSALLMSLKPHLSEKRRKKVDEAVKILRLASLLPLIKSAGIL